MKLHISHSARQSDDPADVDWFVILPLPGETEMSVAGTEITHEMAVQSLRDAGRAVFEIDVTGIPGESAMSISDKPARDVGTLTREIRLAWYIARAGVPFSGEVEQGTYTDPGILEDPRIASLLDARHTAFEWALSEVVDGGYAVDENQLRALANGILPGGRNGDSA